MSPLDLLIFLPVAAAVAMALGAPGRITAQGAALANLAIGLWLAATWQSDVSGYQFTAVRQVACSPVIGFNVGIDGMSLIMVLLTVIVTAAAVWLKPSRDLGKSARMYYASTLLIAAGALGAFVSTDLLFFYAFHELALIPTFLMIGIWGSGDNKAAAWRITIYLGVGSLVLLAALGALVVKSGGTTFDIVTLQTQAQSLPAKTQEYLFVALLVGFGILISLFPFHSWAAPAYASAPAPTAMLHAGVLKKFGLYGLMRVAMPMLPLGANAEWVQHLMLWLLLGNIIFIGLVTIAQKELDMTLGNSSVMHMGYVFLGLAGGSAIGYSGAVLLMFAHGVSIALLFALCAMVREQTKVMQYHRLGGLAAKAPFLGLMFGFAAFASIGLPGFANFAAEILVFFGGFANKPAGHLCAVQWATIFALWGVVISAVYMLRAYRAVFKGELSADCANASDVPVSSRLPLLLLVLALLIPGFYPNLLLKPLAPVTAKLEQIVGKPLPPVPVPAAAVR